MMRITTMAIFLSVFAYAQKNYPINGLVKDQNTGEPITGAIITIKENPEISIETNAYGFYSLSLPENDYTLIITHPNHRSSSKNVHLSEAVKMDWSLEKETEIAAITIDKSRTAVATKSKLGADIIDVQGISKLPVFMGEKDILKTLQFLPGVTAQEGSSGLSVRGGNVDQNLILLDEAPVFNNSHLLGFFSTFNSDALRSITLYKGNIPSQYGGRLSSVLDVKMKDGNNQGYNVRGGIGLISSRLSVEGPIQKGKSSFIISGRRSYLDLITTQEEGEKKDKIYFYDLNAKVNYHINDKNSIYLSGYLGRDVLDVESIKNNWGNVVGTLRWNSILSSKIFSNTSLVYSNYDYRIRLDDDEGKEVLNITPNIRNLILKQDFTHFVSPKHSFKYGLQISHYYFHTPGLSEELFSSFLNKPRYTWENAVYFNDDYKVSEKLFINYGARLSFISSGEKNSGKGSMIKTYTNFEPRVMLNYNFNESNSFSLGYNRNVQPLQLLSNSAGGGTINDIWIGLKKPAVSNQINASYTKKLNKGYEFTGEIYYKKMSNLADFKDGEQSEYLLAENIDNSLLFGGQGRAYGLEVLAKKTKGRLTGWVSYTLSKTERKIDGINDNEWYNAVQDKTHNLSIVASYELNPKWTFSGAFVYSTGNAVTYPVGKYEVAGQTFLQYDKRNAGRMPDYHRLDLSATYEPTNNRRFKSSWTFGIYNVYGRKNPYSISFEPDKNNPNKINAVQTSLFSIVPNVSYNFKF